VLRVSNKAQWSATPLAYHNEGGRFKLSRRRYDPEFKVRVAKEVIETGNGSIVARRYDIAPAVVNRWARAYEKHGPEAFIGKKGSRGVSDPSMDDIKRENDRLKRLLGEKDLEIAILRDLLKKGSHL
jgi:transposase-like protein